MIVEHRAEVRFLKQVLGRWENHGALGELVLENHTIHMPQNLLPVNEFRRLLIEIRDHRPDISARLRMTGQMWMRNFAQIIRVTEKGVLLRDESSGEFLVIQDLSNVMQFEVDHPFRLFQPYFFYEILPFLR